MKGELTLRYYQDPGHGWIAIKRLWLERLGIKDKISGFSYMKGTTVYLEEDCDGSLLLDTLDKQGIDYKLQRIYHDKTPIRRYDNYYHF